MGREGRDGKRREGEEERGEGGKEGRDGKRGEGEEERGEGGKEGRGGREGRERICRKWPLKETAWM